MSACRLCAKEVRVLIGFGEHPIAHRLLKERAAAEFTHHVTLCLCEACGLIQLADPIPPETLYEEYIGVSSWKAQPHVASLLRILEERLDRGASVIEVGSNDGSFLEGLKGRGFSRLLGIEPAGNLVEAAARNGIETLRGYFDPAMARRIAKERGRCGLLVARQVLEHVQDLSGFAEAMSELLAPGGHVLIEVPHFDFCLREPDYSSVWEEHVNYFTKGTLEAFLARAGIRVDHAETFLFSGEALAVFGRLEGGSVPAPPPDPALRARAAAFRDRWPAFRDALAGLVRRHKEQGGKAAVYGAGCRACSLINFAGLGPYLDCVLDDQPEKQDHYMPGSRLPILPGGGLESQGADLCLLAVNAENEAKVVGRHGAWQEEGGRFLSILPPSERLPGFWGGFK